MRENIKLIFFNTREYKSFFLYTEVSYNLQINYHIYPCKIEENLSFA